MIADFKKLKLCLLSRLNPYTDNTRIGYGREKKK